MTQILSGISAHAFRLPPPKFTSSKIRETNPKVLHLISEIVVYGGHLPEQLLPGDYRSWESPEKEDNVYWLFIQILFP